MVKVVGMGRQWQSLSLYGYHNNSLRPIEPDTLRMESPTDDAKSKELPASRAPLQLADIKPGQVGRSPLSAIGFWPGG